MARDRVRGVRVKIHARLFHSTVLAFLPLVLDVSTGACRTRTYVLPASRDQLAPHLHDGVAPFLVPDHILRLDDCLKLLAPLND